MIKHTQFPDDNSGKIQLRQLIRSGMIVVGGNGPLKIYGTLNCKSGKRMLRKNRVFFPSENEALANGFRPCGHCMREKYRQWKTDFSTAGGQP